MSLLSRLEQYKDKIALQDARRAITYDMLKDLVAEKSEKLQGIKCAALAMDNSVDWILWDLAALEAGTTLVPIPPFFTREQVAHILRSAGCSALITEAGIQPLSVSSPAQFPADTAKITFTSGTTGTPKGVCLPWGAMEQVAESLVTVLGQDLARQHCCTLPLAVLLENVAGVYAGLLAGCTITIPNLESFGKNYDKFHAVLRETKTESVILVPEILRTLMKQIMDHGPLPDLRFIALGGSKVAPELIYQARALGLPVYEGYGLSECGSVVALNSPGNDKLGTVGRVLPHVKLQIVNDEIAIENPGFSGYIGEARPGPFLTGDLGELSSDGFLSITGRRKNVLITSNGRNISPEWVESVLLAQPAIAQAIVYGDAEAYLSAVIVPSSPQFDIEAAVEKANAGLPDYAQVKSWMAVPPFTIENGLLTGTGRPRRNSILTLYRKDRTMNFYDTLVKETETARRELYTVPQLVDGLKGNISRETYISYLTEAYHHVKHTVRFMMAMGARLPEEKKWLHDAISEYIEEEKGHEEWILNDIEAAGGNREAARNAVPNLETQVLVSYNYDYIARKNPIGFLGMVFMLESTSIQIANKGADAVRENLNLPKSAFSYLYSHGALDIEHLKFFERTVNRITDPSDQEAILEVARNTFRLFSNVMRAIPHLGAVKHAA